MWSTLKTLLFTTIMMVQAVLSTLIYVPPPSPESRAPIDASPHAFALTALRIFSHLSFVLPQFGGVTSTAQNSFVELKKVFYTALDILSSDAAASQRFVRILCEDARLQGQLIQVASSASSSALTYYPLQLHRIHFLCGSYTRRNRTHWLVSSNWYPS